MTADGSRNELEHQLAEATRQNVRTAARAVGYYAAVWPELAGKMDYTQIARVRFVVETFAELIATGDLEILDLGCGFGWMAPFLSPFGRVTGLDFAEEGIRLAREMHGKDATFFVADTDSPTLGLGSATFDVVVCSEVIEHVPNHSAFLAQISGFLRTGGWCILTTPNGNVWDQFSHHPRYRAELQPTENWIRPRELTLLLRDEGFRIVRHEGRPVYTFRHGLSAPLQQQAVERLFSRARLSHLWGRLIAPGALYQVVAARKEFAAGGGARVSK